MTSRTAAEMEALQKRYERLLSLWRAERRIVRDQKAALHSAARQNADALAAERTLLDAYFDADVEALRLERLFVDETGTNATVSAGASIGTWSAWVAENSKRTDALMELRKLYVQRCRTEAGLEPATSGDQR